MAKRQQLIPVKLTEIPLEQRMRAARIAAKECGDGDDSASVLAAAMFPSEKVYWVRADAFEQDRAA